MVLETHDASNSGYKEKIQTIHGNVVASLKRLRSSMETWASKDTKGLHVKGRLEAQTLRGLDTFKDQYEDLMDKVMNMRSLDPQKRHALEVQMINAFDHAVTEYFSAMQLVWSENVDSSLDHIALNETLNKWMELQPSAFLMQDFTAMPEDVQDSMVAMFGEMIPADIQALIAKLRTAPQTVTDEESQKIMHLNSGLYVGEKMTGTLGSMMLASSPDTAVQRAFEISMEDAQWGKMLLDETIKGRLSITQAQALVENALVYYEAKPEYNRKIRKALDAKIADLKELQTVLKGDDIKKLQDEMQSSKLQQADSLGQSFGRRNHVRALLSPKGIFSAFLMINGSVGLVLNCVTGRCLNPTNMANVAMLGGGLELVNGFDRLLPTPRKLIANLLAQTNKNEEKDQILAKWNAFQLRMGADKNVSQMFSIHENIFKAMQGRDKNNLPILSDMMNEKEQAYWQKVLGVDAETLHAKIVERYRDLEAFTMNDPKNYGSFMSELHAKTKVNSGLSNHRTIIETLS